MVPRRGSAPRTTPRRTARDRESRTRPPHRSAEHRFAERLCAQQDHFEQRRALVTAEIDALLDHQPMLASVRRSSSLEERRPYVREARDDLEALAERRRAHDRETERPVRE